MQNEEIAKIIGENVKLYRIEKNLSQKDLAFEACINRKVVVSLEEGKELPALDALIAIARTLDVELICLFIGVRIRHKKSI